MGAEAGIPLTHQPIDALRKKITVTLLKTVHCRGLHVFVRPRSTILPVHQLPKTLIANSTNSAILEAAHMFGTPA
jgi:hypothetical protein